MKSGRCSSPFPSTGGPVPSGSPARRQFSSEEAAALLRSTKIEGPPGPSSETVINGLPFIGTSHSTNNNNNSTNSKPFAHGGIIGGSRAAPARLRATPECALPPSPSPNTLGEGSTRRKSGKGGTPAATAGNAVGNINSNVNTNPERFTPFEEEIFAIGRLNKVIPEGRGGGAGASSSSVGGQGNGFARPGSSLAAYNGGEEEAALNLMLSRGGRSTPTSLSGGGGGGDLSLTLGGGKGRLTPIPSLKHRASSPLLTVATTTAGAGRSSSRLGAADSHSVINNTLVANTTTNMSSIGLSGGASAHGNPWASASHAGKRGVQPAAPLRSIQPSPQLHQEPTTLSSEDVQNFFVNENSYCVGGVAGASSFSSSIYQSEAPPAEEDEHPNRTATSKPIHVPYAPDIRPSIAAGGGGAKGTRGPPRQPLVLQDYVMIAEACQRASRVRIEGAAYYKIGELLSKNKRDTLHKAVPYFKKYLNISRRLQDAQGEGKALNVLGCTYFALQNHTREMGGRSLEEIIATSLEYHQEHAAVADAAGLFIAQTNMGLCYRALGDLQQAAECYKSAMQLAVRSGDRVAEALALANLTEVGSSQGDIQTAQVCVERNLEIAASTKDARVGCEAYEQLGTLSMLRGDYASATEAFLMGLEVALTEGDSVKSAELRCKIGLVQGKMRMQEQMAQAVKKMSSGGMQ